MDAASEQIDEIEETAFRWLLAGMGALPLLSYVALLLLACGAFFYSGHWPANNYPDPKSLPFSGGVATVWLTLVIAACGTPVYMVAFSVHVVHVRLRPSRIDIIGLAACGTGLVLWMLASRDLLGWFIFD